jgi:hypothetical protein
MIECKLYMSIIPYVYLIIFILDRRHNANQQQREKKNQEPDLINHSKNDNMVPSIVPPIIYHLLSRILQKISLYKSRKHHLCEFSHIYILLFCTSHHCSADTYDNIYKCFPRVQDTDHVDAGTANKHPSIMCPAIEPIRVSSCSCHDRCKINLPSCRLKPPSPKPVKRKRKGQKKIKLAKKDLSSNSGTNVPRHLSEKLKKRKLPCIKPSETQ